MSKDDATERSAPAVAIRRRDTRPYGSRPGDSAIANLAHSVEATQACTALLVLRVLATALWSATATLVVAVLIWAVYTHSVPVLGVMAAAATVVASIAAEYGVGEIKRVIGPVVPAPPAESVSR